MRRRTLGGFPLVVALLATSCLAPDPMELSSGGVRRSRTPKGPCQPCQDFDYLCCDMPADGIFKITTFGGTDDRRYHKRQMACGRKADGRWAYATSWVRWHCGAKIEIRNPRSGACTVAEVADAGPNARIEREAGGPVIDVSPVVCLALFGDYACVRQPVSVREVDESTPTGAHCTPLPDDAPSSAGTSDSSGDWNEDSWSMDEDTDDDDPNDPFGHCHCDSTSACERDLLGDPCWCDTDCWLPWNPSCDCDTSWACSAEREDPEVQCECDLDCYNAFNPLCGCDLTFSCDGDPYSCDSTAGVCDEREPGYRDCPCDQDCPGSW